ncbi:baseplate multidomain protein megatron [Agrobacterium vaccinii]|uniref:baseplate multidomain protein megatron n=1 Tax=Agrobacterium vaccinii TaxID=2735528 RepID=UPI001E44CDE8|nr:glycoside hydrolase TIM-barrel-like domain-containing protein [Agrobacterium vaccinii]UHS56036.1 glycoside hydrolase TIM-barrel-like domain-containing protein [Agrobacterium vaccinii]
MATLVLQAAGAAVGSLFGPVGAIIGRAAGALAGSAIDSALLSSSRTVTGARLSTARIPGAEEGAAMSRAYGTVRIGGTLIWATRFEESVTRERQGGKGSNSGSTTTVETFTYFANIAIGLCEGEVAMVRRVWADGQELDLTGIETRFYPGSDDQLPDPLIEAKQGAGNSPAYRGLSYMVFERLPLDSFGNRIPLLQFEVIRPIGRLERQMRAVTVIPGATEYGYATTAVSERTGAGESRILNRNTLVAATDWQASIDELQALCPNLASVALVVTWFGTDMRAGECRVLPGVEVAHRDRESATWSVAGMGRGQARLVSHRDGGPAYGGTPSDASVLQAIADLKTRGLKVCLYPFVMMDVPSGNGLHDPYGKSEQDAYGWRGNITCHPAAGRAGSVDRTAAGRAQVTAFSTRADGYRRMVMHYAALAKQAGGVDAFLIGSELRGLTRVRDQVGAFPFVEELVRLAGDVRGMLGAATKLTYAADWSEYFGYHPADGSGDVFFNLDPLWASPAIDAVGIDNYMPVSDWRDEDVEGGNPDGFVGADDASGFARNVTAGEGFDWYYASDADRAARRRSAISDGLKGNHWLYRYKDLAGWWQNRHYDRVGGAERAAPTAWMPGMKPFWFTELGCPAIDKGANRPNTFIDPKSSESAFPYFSTRNRADSQQRRFLEAHHDHWAGAAAPAGMVDPDRIFVWTWDARPYPAFPQDTASWSDGANWRTGHWLNGRLGATTLADLISAVLTEHGFTDYDVAAVTGDVGGYVQGDVTAARNLLEPLLDAFQVDVIEDGTVLRFVSRGKAATRTTVISAYADIEDAALWSEARGHDSDFAAEAVLTAFNPALDYEQASVRSRRIENAGNRVLRYDLGSVLAQETAQNAVEALLRDNRLARRTVRFSISPQEIALDPGDCVQLAGGPSGRFLVSRIEDGDVRRIEAREFSPAAAAASGETEPSRNGSGGASDGFDPDIVLMDLPRFETGEAAGFARVAAYARPWRRMALSVSAGTEGYEARAVLDQPAKIGALTSALPPGLAGRFNPAGTIDITLPYGDLASASDLAVLNGANRIAIRRANGAWEVAAFGRAQEVASGVWRLSRLLRGLAGTEDAMAAGAVSGSDVVILDAGVVAMGLRSEERGLQLNWIIEAAGKQISSIGPFAFAGGTRAETPLAPVHLRAVPQADGVRLTWVRRGRVDADGWDAADIPLDEVAERYRVDILAGEAVRRTIEVAEAACLYAANDEISDFGAKQATLSVRVRQLGRAVPLGIAASAILDL